MFNKWLKYPCIIMKCHIKIVISLAKSKLNYFQDKNIKLEKKKKKKREQILSFKWMPTLKEIVSNRNWTGFTFLWNIAITQDRFNNFCGVFHVTFYKSNTIFFFTFGRILHINSKGDSHNKYGKR